MVDPDNVWAGAVLAALWFLAERAFSCPPSFGTLERPRVAFEVGPPPAATAAQAPQPPDPPERRAHAPYAIRTVADVKDACVRVVADTGCIVFLHLDLHGQINIAAHRNPDPYTRRH